MHEIKFSQIGYLYYTVTYYPRFDVVGLPIRKAELHQKGVEQSQFFLKVVIFYKCVGPANII